MNYNQYYGGQENYMSMQNNQPYYQSTAMSTSPQTPIMNASSTVNPSPQTNQILQMNPVPQMNQVPQTNSFPQPNVQYQYSNNSAMNYSHPVTPMINSTMTPNQYNPQSGVMNQVISNPTPQNYSPARTNQFPIMQQNQNSGVYPTPNAYATNTQVDYKGMVLPQANNVPTVLGNTVFTDAQQYTVPMSQQLSYSPNGTIPQVPNSQVQPVYGGEPCNLQSPQNPVNISNGGKQVEAAFFKPTNVIGQYKCSDFPTLYTGSYRYPGAPIQRKPFTMKGESMKPTHDRRTSIGLNKYGKRWELRGGKYYGCFTSRTNGLQDNCPKAKCRLCPIENKKKQ